MGIEQDASTLARALYLKTNFGSDIFPVAEPNGLTSDGSNGSGCCDSPGRRAGISMAKSRMTCGFSSSRRKAEYGSRNDKMKPMPSFVRPLQRMS